MIILFIKVLVAIVTSSDYVVALLNVAFVCIWKLLNVIVWKLFYLFKINDKKGNKVTKVIIN